MLLRSMSSAISGLRGHQTWLDVVGNNIANLSTPGFKASRVRFEDMLAQTTAGAMTPDETAGRGARNPMQVGLGTGVGGIETMTTPGPVQATSKASHLAIQGEGYFIVRAGGQTYYTRDGSFDLGVDARLVNPSTGMYVLGWQADNAGNIDVTQPLTEILIPIGNQLDAQATTALQIQGNLDAAYAVGDTYQTQVSLVDSLGFEHLITVEFAKTANNRWTYTYSTAEAGVTIANATGTIDFDALGRFSAVTPSGPLTIQWGNGAADTILNDGGDFSILTQYNDAATATAVGNGNTASGLVSFAVGESGRIIGIYSNGSTKTLGQIATAVFPNPGGLLKSGKNNLTPSPASGLPIVGIPGQGGRGNIYSSHLEMSNVDLAEQFTNMIVAERGFQANSRVVTTSDEVLQELVNIKR